MTRHEIARALAGILADMPRSRNVDSNSDRIERAIQTLELRWGATLQVVPDTVTMSPETDAQFTLDWTASARGNLTALVGASQ